MYLLAVLSNLVRAFIHLFILKGKCKLEA